MLESKMKYYFHFRSMGIFTSALEQEESLKSIVIHLTIELYGFPMKFFTSTMIYRGGTFFILTQLFRKKSDLTKHLAVNKL